MTLYQILGSVLAAIVTAGGQYLMHPQDPTVRVIVAGAIGAASYLGGVVHGANGATSRDGQLLR